VDKREAEVVRWRGLPAIGGIEGSRESARGGSRHKILRPS